MSIAGRRVWEGISMLRSLLYALLVPIGMSRLALASEPVDLDEQALPLPKAVVRSEAERDRLEAVSLFSAGRLFEQRQDLPAALRRYERAFRLDPSAEPILREIIPLAFGLGREEEAVRYATKLAKLDAPDPTLLKRLGVVLTEQGEYKQAIALYEKVRELETAEPKTAAAVTLQLEMGRLYVLEGEFDKAAELFVVVSKALDAPQDYGLNSVLLKTLAGDKGEVHELVATAFLEAGQLEDAAKAFARLEKMSSNKAVAAYNQARIAAKAGRHDEALAKLEEYFASRELSKGVAPYELFAKVLREKQQADQIIPRFEKLLAEQAGNIPLSFALAEEYFQRNELDKALPHYKSVLASQPSAPVYRRLLEIYRNSADDENLLALLGEISAKSGSLEIVEKQIDSLVEDKKRVDSLIKLARDKFKEAKPDHYDVLHAAGLVALESKQYEASADLFELAIKAKPAEKAQVLLRFGLELFLAQKFSDAAKQFQRGIVEKALPDSNPAFYFYLAGALAMDGRTDEALAAARTAAEKKPDDPRFESRIAWVYYHAKRYDEAVEHYRELLARYDGKYDSPDARSVVHDTRLILSNIAVIQERLPEAEEWIEQVLDEFPDDIGAMNDLGYLWADQNKRLERAHRMIQQAVTAEPDNGAYRDSLGWVLYRLGRHEEALVEQKKAVELTTSTDKEADGVMYDHLGDIHAALRQQKEAAAAWRQAATAFENASETDKLEAVQKKMK